ncbi:hypothetical protein FGO68_gene6353 [Halteria grandinella]|uniref:Uncharacterized protein n=1 Tax=Halteria grandinella TaxID=5974 RepID=A0A8J8T1P4_HALGN|nr:hypothetical protein FGO68_gene6353 [Halteria grandinella]
MCSGGKSPKGECFILGSSLLSEGLKGLLVLLVKSFLRWSSTIIVDAQEILGMFIPPMVFPPWCPWAIFLKRLSFSYISDQFLFHI